MQVITEKVPYQNIIDEVALVEVVGQRVMPALIDELPCPPRAQNVIGLCWKWESDSRPSLSEIISILSGSLCKFTEAWSVAVENLTCLRFSYDGKFLVVAFSEFGIRVYDAETGPAYRSIRMSRSGRFLIASNYDHEVLLWDLETRKLKDTFQEHTDDIWALDISPDDSYVISGSNDKTIRQWRPAVQKDNKKLLQKAKEGLRCPVISPVADVVAISIFAHRNELIDANTGETIAVLERPEQSWTLRFSPDGKRIYGGCNEGLVCYWDVGDLSLNKRKVLGSLSRPYQEIKGAKGLVLSVSVSNSWVVSISSDGDVRAMKLEPGATWTKSIGRVSQFNYTNHGDLSPVSEDGVGLAVSCPEQSELLTVYRYMSWDKPGMYM
ncbi:hypothetical protein FRB99_002672 [Tulasnella sp. 403]|nr:hypothetical protein FRB99_002672 [Tulasnella sp. 403]